VVNAGPLKRKEQHCKYSCSGCSRGVEAQQVQADKGDLVLELAALQVRCHECGDRRGRGGACDATPTPVN
jgi:DNA-directed RNA polymerase subunit RPC12/RpoP